MAFIGIDEIGQSDFCQDHVDAHDTTKNIVEVLLRFRKEVFAPKKRSEGYVHHLNPSSQCASRTYCFNTATDLCSLLLVGDKSHRKHLCTDSARFEAIGQERALRFGVD